MENSSHWWDKLGEPQYGGELNIRLNRKIVNLDPYYGHHLTQLHTGWMEKMFADDWTADPEINDYANAVGASRVAHGHLAESWEFADTHTFVVHLRKGIHWQNIPPANGREFIADDVVFHFHRMFGLGSGYSEPSKAMADFVSYKELESVSADGRYTVIFKWRTSNRNLILDALQDVVTSLCIENPEAVREWGDVRDWQHAVGTGPFELKEFDGEQGAVMVKNHDYWGHDERHPQNQLPYINRLYFKIIPDQRQAIEQLRAGKIDVVDQISPILAMELRKTNPEILQLTLPQTATTIDPRNDKPPFNDIRVRKALQLAIDLQGLAKDYYKGTVDPYPSTLTSRFMKGWGFPYEEWPQELKDEYAYAPALARKLLADAGYPDGFKTNIVADAAGDIELLKLCKAYFADIGVEMEIRLLESTDWMAFVLKGRRHDQLAQRPVSPFGHTFEPIRQLSRLHTGYSSNYLMVSDPVFDGLQSKAIAATSEKEIKQILRDANERIARQHFSISLLQPLQYAFFQPWLKGYHGQFGSVCSAAGSPQMLFFYPARFWIDQKLKQEMGC